MVRCLEEDIQSLAGHAAMHPFIHDHGGREGAGAQAHHALQAELVVGCGLTRFNPQLVGERLNQLLATAHMAGGAFTDAQTVLAGRIETELGVKGGDAIDIVC